MGDRISTLRIVENWRHLQKHRTGLKEPAEIRQPRLTCLSVLLLCKAAEVRKRDGVHLRQVVGYFPPSDIYYLQHWTPPKHVESREEHLVTCLLGVPPVEFEVCQVGDAKPEASDYHARSISFEQERPLPVHLRDH